MSEARAALSSLGLVPSDAVSLSKAGSKVNRIRVHIKVSRQPGRSGE
jgi:hypothetical protein